LNAKNMKPGEIHRQLCDVYGEHAMNSSVVRRWTRLFNEGHKNVHNDLRSGRPSVVNEDLVRTVEEKIRENRRFLITSLCLHFLKFHGHFTKFYVINLRFRNCVQTGWRSCLGKNTD